MHYITQIYASSVAPTYLFKDNLQKYRFDTVRSIKYNDRFSDQKL